MINEVKQQKINSTNRKNAYLQYGKDIAHINDFFSASWLMNVRQFRGINTDRIAICEDACFQPFRQYSDKIRMTRDWLELAVEHMSKWWKIIDIFNHPPVLERFIELLDNFEQEPPSNIAFSGLRNTIALIAFMPYGRGRTDGQGQALTVSMLSACLRSMSRYGMGRVVVVVPTIKDKNTYESLIPNLFGETTVVFRVAKEVKTRFITTNMPFGAIWGLQRAFESDDDNWLGDVTRWDAVYLTEPDTLLHIKPTILPELMDGVLNRGWILSPHRLQPIPHESDLPSRLTPIIVVPDNEHYKVKTVESYTTRCWDMGNDRPYGEEATSPRNPKKCDNFWYICGFRSGDHASLRPYELMRLTNGIGITMLMGNEHGRQCYIEPLDIKTTNEGLIKKERTMRRGKQVVTFLQEQYPYIGKSFYLSKKNGVFKIQDNGGINTTNSTIIDLIIKADACFDFDFIPLTLILTDSSYSIEKEVVIREELANPYIKILSFCTEKDKKREYLLPDYHFVALYEKKIGERIAKSGDNSWTKNKIGWSGVQNTITKEFIHKESLSALGKAYPDILDYQFVDKFETVEQGLFQLPHQILDTSYKYCLDLSCGGYGEDLKFLLYSKRVCFIQNRATKEWYWDGLEPYIHYIPIKEDLSDLIQQYNWIENNPDEYQRIAYNAYLYACEFITYSKALTQIKNAFSMSEIFTAIEAKPKRVHVKNTLRKNGQVKNELIKKEKRNKFIDLKKITFYIINLERDKEKRQFMEQQMKDLDLKHHFIPAVHTEPATAGVGLSHLKTLRLAGLQLPFAILEDDCQFFYDRFDTILSVPEDTDAFYLGHSTFGPRPADESGIQWGQNLKATYKIYDEQYIRIWSMMATHGIIYLSEKFRQGAIEACLKTLLNHDFPYLIDVEYAQIQKDYLILSPQRPWCYQSEQYKGNYRATKHALIDKIAPME